MANMFFAGGSKGTSAASSKASLSCLEFSFLMIFKTVWKTSADGFLFLLFPSLTSLPLPDDLGDLFQSKPFYDNVPQFSIFFLSSFSTCAEARDNQMNKVFNNNSAKNKAHRKITLCSSVRNCSTSLKE